MRIALIVPGGVDRSGEYRVIPALLSLLERLCDGNDVQVIALRQEHQPGEWRLLGAQIHNMGVPRSGLRALRKIYRLHRAAPFDLVQAIFSGSCGLVAALAGTLLRIPSLVHVGGGELVSLPDIPYGGAQTWRGRRRESWVLRHVSAVTAASAPVIESLAALRVQAQRLPLGVDLNHWPPRAPVRRDPRGPVRLIHVASLNGVKDQSTLLRALHSLKHSGMAFEMSIVGEDTLQGRIQHQAAQLGLAQHLRFTGFLTQQALRPVMEAADLMVISSRHEAGPLVVLEAAIAGVPTVGTAVGHLLEWSPEAALSVPVQDWSALAGAIRRMALDEELRIRVAEQAQARALAVDADFTARSFLQIYERLTSN